VILIDANLLIYAYNPAASEHTRAKTWLSGVLSQPEPVRLALITVLAFMRILSNPRLFRRPLSIMEATAIVNSWIERPAVDILQPTPRHWMILRDLLEKGQSQGPLVSDAHLAALAIEHGATLCTTDRDFSRFPGLRFVNPLEQSG
jgi:hypothetical protein